MADERHRPLIDVLVDAALAATLVGWAIAGLVKGRVATPVGMTLVTVNVVVGFLFLTRQRVRRRASPVEIAIAVPSVLMGPAAMMVAPPAERWPVEANALFMVAAAGLVVSLVTLGTSFSVLPALREVVARGPYRLVRHPIYLAELAMVAAAAGLAARSAVGFGVIAATVVTLGLRIVVEERVLMSDDAYQAYREQVRWRLIPYLW